MTTDTKERIKHNISYFLFMLFFMTLILFLIKGCTTDGLIYAVKFGLGFATGSAVANWFTKAV